MDKVEKRFNRSTREVTDRANSQGTTSAQAVTREVKTKGHIVIPYTQGLCESIKKMCGRYDIWTRWRKDLTGPPERSLIGLIAKALQVPKLSPGKLKLRVTLSYPTHKVFVKVSKRCVVDMAFKPTSKMAVPSKTSWSSQLQRPYGQPKWCHILIPMWWPRLWWWIHGRNLQDLWWKIQRAPEGPLIHSSPQQPYRPPHQSQ